MIGITGGPNTGKTTLAQSMGGPCVHTDDFIGMGWSEASEHVASLFGGNGLVEGVALPRALRKWLDANPNGRPLERLIVLSVPHVARNDGQERMAKGHDTVLNGILPELERRGVVIDRAD